MFLMFPGAVQTRPREPGAWEMNKEGNRSYHQDQRGIRLLHQKWTMGTWPYIWLDMVSQ